MLPNNTQLILGESEKYAHLSTLLHLIKSNAVMFPWMLALCLLSCQPAVM